MKKINEEKLLQEYADFNKNPEFVFINHQKILVPIEYTFDRNKNEIFRDFLHDYLDVQKKDIEAYQKRNLSVEKIIWNGMPFVVPFHLRNKNYRDTEIVDCVLKRAQAKFERAVTLTRKMDKAFPERKYTVEIALEHVDALQNAYNAYLANNCREKISYATIKVADYLLSGFKFMKGKNSPFSKLKLEKAAHKIALTSLLTGGVAWGFSSSYQNMQDAKNNDFDKEFFQEQSSETKFYDETALSVDNEVKTIETSSSRSETKKVTLDNISEKTKNLKNKIQEHLVDLPKEDIKTVAQIMAHSDENSVTKDFQRSDKDKTRLFYKYMEEIFENEGGYADKTIDQPTNMGIIQPTLNSFLKKYPDLAKKNNFPSTVKGLKKKHALLVYRKLYFDFYKIGEYRNESIGMFIYDMYVNHDPSSVKRFVQQALKAAKKIDNQINIPQDLNEQVHEINSLAHNPEAEKIFYNQMIIERRFHMYKNTTLKAKNGKTSRFADGLRNRVNKYEDKFVETKKQEASAQQYALWQGHSRE